MGSGFERIPLGRSEPGSNRLIIVSASGRTADLSWGGFDRLVVTRRRVSAADWGMGG
jgi:hypothetical protein